MKKIIIAWILVFTSFGYSQNCKYEKNEIDEFTKNKILETKFEWLTPNQGYAFKKINKSKNLKIKLNYNSVFSIRKNDKIMFLTENNEPITLLFEETVISNILNLNNFYIITLINISDKIVDRFKNESINKIRIYYSDGYLDYDVKEKRAKKFKEILKCIE